MACQAAEDCCFYNIVVYVDRAGDPMCPGGFCSTDAGDVYGGHDPCECGDNLRFCEFWDVLGCTPDPYGQVAACALAGEGCGVGVIRERPLPV